MSHWIILSCVPQTLLSWLSSSSSLRAFILHQILWHHYLLLLCHSGQMMGIVFLMTYSTVLSLTWRLNPQKIIHRLSSLIKMVSYNSIQPSATRISDHVRLGDWFPASLPSGFSPQSFSNRNTSWDLPWHHLCFPSSHTAPRSDPGWPWICQHCYCMPLCLPKSSVNQKPTLSEMVTVRLSCPLLGFLCSLCLDILCTTELGMPWAGHFLSHALIPGSPLLLDTYAGLCHLQRVFSPDTSSWPNLSCTLKLLLQCHLWGSGIHP